MRRLFAFVILILIFKSCSWDNEETLYPGPVDYTAAGIYPVKVEGDMTIHGVTRQVSAEGTIEVTGDGITARTEFKLNPEDYDIKIPGVVRNNIAEQMVISAELNCQVI